MSISIIIPTYNERDVIEKCLRSIAKQTVTVEIIMVDDGSTDGTGELVSVFQENFPQLLFFKQEHKGPAAARNLGARQASGEILVFVDSDMTFEPNFIEELTKPIIGMKTKGTFSKREFVSNWENKWARFWNFNQGIFDKLRIPADFPDESPVFRAILASEFRKVNGYTEGIGWTDDWTLSQKLGYKATATNAKYYHENPDNLKEVFNQAKWIGKNDFISGSTTTFTRNIVRYNIFTSMGIGIIKMIQFKKLSFFVFKFVYDAGMFLGMLSRLVTNNKNK